MYFKVESFKFVRHFDLQVLKDAGVIPGYDMTPEAALTKLSYVAAMKDMSIEAKRQVENPPYF